MWLVLYDIEMMNEDDDDDDDVRLVSHWLTGVAMMVGASSSAVPDFERLIQMVKTDPLLYLAVNFVAYYMRI